MISLAAILVLLVVFQLKHFLADFPLQKEWMLGKFSEDWRVWILALVAHAGVHAFGTFGISLLFMAQTRGYPLAIGLSLGLALLDFAVHFAMDRIKASPRLLGRFKALSASEFRIVVQAPDFYWKDIRSNRLFWWSLGLDQMVHHLTHYAIILILITR